MALFSACSSEDDIKPIYTVGEADNVITLRVGVSTGESDVQTRATDSDHTNHLSLTPDTEAALRIDGKWTGHSPENNVSQLTTATIGSVITSFDNKHNSVSMSPVLYWDDYGTADPANTSGRNTGLTIYGVAVDGYKTEENFALPSETTNNLTTISNWEALPWTLPANQTSGWANYDLLTSNNIKEGSDGTLKFDDVKNNSASDLLVFTHAMSKITVNLKAGEGFPGYTESSSNAKFEKIPSVKLLSLYNSGTYNVETKSPNASKTATDIQMHLSSGGAGNNTATFDALVFPGNSWTAESANSTNILELEADGNIYKVTAKKLFEAMNEENHSAITQGYNYVLNITVNKTKVNVEATIKDWDEVNSDPVAPEINISANYGQPVTGSNAFTKSFDLYRSTTIATGYDENGTSDGINPAATYTYSGTSGSWDKTIYWPNHETHYFFRGVYPQGHTVITEGGNDVISVTNATYNQETAPSDLMIALPRFSGRCENHNKVIETNGICATKGTITMNFEYAMSKVELRLKSDGTEGLDYVDLTQSGTKVEIIDGYKQGKIKLEDGLHTTYTDSDKGDYGLSKQATPASGFQMSTLDAIVPQELSDNVLFKITVKNSDGTTDVYTAQVNKIKGKKASETTATATEITEWKHGEHYIYTLDVKKSQIFVSATITDWTTVDASDDVWM